ncbi:hypothetical protein JTB14_014001 [Gonioctena quinquepunctata]|nr:hypothetical protein JTB14_014001 [Gonioctena quinquepunctata]
MGNGLENCYLVPMDKPTNLRDRKTMEKSDDSETSPSDSDGENETEKKMKVPPIILRDKTKWIPLRNYMYKCVPKIGYTKVQNLNDGLKIQPNDYKKIQDIFTRKGVPYHTFTLPEDKLLRVVFRCVPTEFDEKDIKKDLEDQGFDITSVSSMKKYDKTPMPMVLVLSGRENKSIYDVREILDIIVRAESQKPRTSVA